METHHPEGKSPFIPDEGLSDPKNASESQVDGAGDGYVECPIDGCNEVVAGNELDYHLELHAGEAEEDAVPEAPDSHLKHSTEAGEDEPQARSAKRRRSSLRHDPSQDSDEAAAHASHKKAISAWRNIFSKPKLSKSKQASSNGATSTDTDESPKPKVPKKLGKSELGRYAHEARMPDWLVSLLKRGGHVVGTDVIPVLAQLLEQCSTTEYAYLCSPAVQHISKLRLEGGFCGYRNIQMLSSYVINTGYQGAHHFNGQLPTIFDIQEFIEAAWDRGINKQGRVETGGVRGTRKYIGTPEAQAVFKYLEVPCEPQGFKQKKEPGAAEELLLASIERYFEQAIFNPEDRVRCTQLPPIYFQHMGHSMTIVGLEKQVDGKKNLLVFDPTFRDSSVITQRIGTTFMYRHADHVLNAYRRGHKYLKRYREFEVLTSVFPSQSFLLLSARSEPSHANIHGIPIDLNHPRAQYTGASGFPMNRVRSEAHITRLTIWGLVIRLRLLRIGLQASARPDCLAR